jgi:hypothetical protein
MDLTNPLLSTGDVAKALGVSRDSLIWALRMGAPGPADRIAGRRVYCTEDVAALQRWFSDRKHNVGAVSAKGGV